MRWKKVKTVSEIKGFSIEEPELRDGSIFAITLTGSDGHRLKISKDGWSDLAFLVPEPPKMVEKWRLTANLADDKTVELLFDEEHRAIAAKCQFVEDSRLTIEKIMVPEETAQ